MQFLSRFLVSLCKTAAELFSWQTYRFANGFLKTTDLKAKTTSKTGVSIFSKTAETQKALFV